ncbi:MAG: TaqI-like C-terminal specificity domain-containing protein [Candidatus Odinarchaeota archaeon]
MTYRDGTAKSVDTPGVLLSKYRDRKLELEKQLQVTDTEEKKRNGAFFTPFETAVWLFNLFIMPWLKKHVESGIKKEATPLNIVKRLASISLLEPGFGRADFLLAAFKCMNEYYNTLSRDLFLPQTSIENKDNQIDLFLKNRATFILKYNLRGIERDLLLYELGLINLSLFTGIDILNSSELKQNYLNADFFDVIHFQIPHKTSNKQEKQSNAVFNLIFGNPPWGANISSEFRDQVEMLDKHIKTVTGATGKETKADSFIYFSIKSLDLLEPGGRLGFLVPNFLMTNPSMTGARKLLLKYKLESIVNLQEDLFDNVTMPSCFFTVDKVQSKKEDLIQVYRQLEKGTVEKIHSIMHGTVQKSSLCRIPLAKQDSSALGKHKVKMGDLLKNGRGIEIGKKGSVTACPACGNYRPVPRKSQLCSCPSCGEEFNSSSYQKNIIKESIEENNVTDSNQKLIIGAQVKKFQLTDPDRYIIELGVKGINYKHHLMRAPKILIRKTGSGINAVVDTLGLYTVQVVYILYFPSFQYRFKGYSLDYICALLNSTTMSELYFSSFSDPSKSRFPHLIQRNLLELPVPETPTFLTKQIEKAVKTIPISSEGLCESKLKKINDLVKQAFKY